MDLDFAHGFIPRIGEENYKAVDRCVGPTDLFSGDPLELPWAIADGAWAQRRPELLDTLRGHGTELLFDTAGWRYRYPATAEVAKLRDTSWAPPTPLQPGDHDAIRKLVRDSIRAQAELKAGAYLVPGLLPADKDEDLRSAYAAIIAAAEACVDVPAKPFVLFVGGHTSSPELTAALLDEIPLFVAGVYVQLTPISPVADTASKLENVSATYMHAQDRGFRVIAGHAAAIGPALHALGVDAADAGLAIGETFDQTRARRAPKKNEGEDTPSKGGRRARMYFEQIGRPLEAKDVDRALVVPGAAAELRGCRLPCHRFRSDHLLEQAREHSLWARVTDAQLVHSLPPSMRATAMYERLRRQRSTLTRINGALEAAGQPPFAIKPVENHLTWISRSISARSVA